MPGKYDAFLKSSSEAARNRRNEFSSLNNAQQRTGRYDDFLNQSRGASNRAVPVTPPVQPQEESGLFKNSLKAPVDRSLGLTDDLFGFINTINQSAEDKLYQMGLRSAPNVQPDSAKNTAKPDAGDMPFINMLVGKENLIETAREKVSYDPNRGVDWQEYKDDWTNPKKLASFIWEQGIKSVPDMVATLFALPAYVAARTQEIAETREVNKTYDPATNTFIDDPDGKVTFTDLVEALPSAVAVALAERFGAKSIFTPKPGDTLKKRVARGASREGATEFVQENIEYGGEVLGTPVDYDLKTGLDRGFAGLVAGAGFGGPLAAGDSLLRGNPLADAVARGRQDAKSKGGDGLDQATEAAGNAAASPLDRQRARLGLSTEPGVLMDPADLAGTTAENPIAVDGNTATINTPSGTTTIEMDTAQQAVETAQALQARSATTLPAPVIEPQTRQPLAPALDPTNDPLQFATDTIALNQRDMRAADAAGDFEGADALYEDAVLLRSAETALRRANTLAKNGSKAASDAIIARVMPVLQEEAGRRQAAMEPAQVQSDLVQVQSEPVLSEDQGTIFAEGSTEPANLPARVTRLKSQGKAYPTRKAAEAAMTRVRRGEPDYQWSVKKATGGFALEGNLPGAEAINETEDQRLMSQATELEAIAEGSSEVSISDQLAAYESELSETTAKLNELQARLAAETKRDQSGVLVKNPIQRAMTIKNTDDLLLTIVKLGGINIEDANGNGFEPKLDNPKSNSVGAYRLFKKDGMTFDALREALQERGWYNQEDPNRPSVLYANEVMEDIREAVILAQDNEFVYKGDKQAEIEFLKRDISFAEESLRELEGIVFSYKTEVSPEEAGRTDFIGITDSDVLNSINYFDEVQGAFNEDRAYPQEGAETVGGDSQAIDTGGIRRVESGATGVQRVDEELSEAGSQTSDGATRPNIQDRGLDPNGDTSAAVNQTEPLGSVSRSGPDGFELESYTEGDITSLENRDIDALDAREQNEREGENFALSGGDATVATGSDRMQNTQGNDLFSQDPAQTENDGSDTAFSVRQGATRNIPIITDEELDTVFKRVTGKDRNDSNSIFVVPSYSDLPQDIRDRAERMGHPASDVRGAFHRGSIYVVRNQIKGKNDFEQVLLHEATHGGFRDMLGDRGVNTALNKLFASMGGREGFEQTLIDLGIEADLKPYKESLEKEGGSVDRRNAILLDEMLAFTGQKGSKGIKLRIQELIGAIRAWLAKNGYVNLSKTSASDIALMARRARENYFANSTDRNDTAFSLAQRKARAQKNNQSLYSNAEQTILDEGYKIFKASKKNPDASVRGDQILSFLKGRGIKKDELQYTRLEEFLTEPQPAAAMADFENAKPRRYTQEEVIAYLRNAAPQFSEEGVDERNVANNGLNFGEPEIKDSPDYYAGFVDVIVDEAEKDQWDEYNASQVLEKVFKENPEKLNEMLANAGINPSDLEQAENSESFNEDSATQFSPTVASVAQAFEEQGESLWGAVQNTFQSEFDDGSQALAKAIYMEGDPVVVIEGSFNQDQGSIKIEGSDDYGYTISYEGSIVNQRETRDGRTVTDPIYDLDEAKVTAQMHLYEQGELYDNGDTKFFDYLKIADEKIDNYREIRQQLSDNAMAPNDKEFEGGHFESNVLYATLVTDRSWPAGDTYVIEELQSDWHSNIRKNGSTYDRDKYVDAQDALDKALRIERDAKADVAEIENTIYEKAISKNSPESSKAIRAESLTDYLDIKSMGYFSEKGIQKLKEIGPRLEDFENASQTFLYLDALNEAFPPGSVPELFFTLRDLRSTIEEENFRTFKSIRNIDVNEELVDIFSQAEIDEVRSYFSPKVLENARLRKKNQQEILAGQNPGNEVMYDESLTPVFWMGDRTSTFPSNDTRDKAEKTIRFGLQDDLFSDSLEAISGVERARDTLEDARLNVFNEGLIVARELNAPPDSPFRDDRYLELAAKRAVIQAVSENKDAIAFSKADRVQARWGDRNDYTAIYDRKLRKIMDKTMGQAPQSVDANGEIDDSTSEGFWSYDITPELREEIEYEGLPMFSLRPEEGSIRIPSKGETKIADKFIKGLQDKFLPIKRLQQSIEETRGRKLFEEEDAYLAEEMFYGKTEEDLRQIELEFVEPLMKDMESSGISVKELDDFLMAKHAPERNREVAKINAALPDGGSGLTTREANEHLASVAEDSQKLANLERLAGRVYEMTTLTRELLVNGGLISEEEVSSWDNKYDFYVPLKGFADNELNDKGFAIRTGKGYEIQGKESRRALGRRSKADSPLVQVISDLTEKTIRNRKNEVGQSLLTLAENNPDSMFWKVFTADNPDTKDTWNAQANKVVTGPVDMARDDRYFGVKRDGKAYYIRIEDERILDTMRKVGPQAQNALINMMGAATRWLSFVNTAANPEFVITNFTRDIQAAGINILAEQSKDGGRIEGEELAARAVNLKNVGGAVAAIAEYHRNKRTEPKAGNEYQQYYQEFMETGGKTGFFDSPDLDKIAKDLNGRLQESGTGKKVKEVGKNILDFVTDYNTAVENGIRLSTYVEARKVGLSAKKASSLAKNLTVNFNRKGDYGQVLNSAYMFFNAAVQGLAQFSVTMSPFQVDSKGDWKLQRKVNTAQKVAGGIVVSAAMLANVNRLIGGEDDDGEAYWDKVSPAIRERNIVFMKPDGSGEYYKFPLPYGFNFFYNLGDVLEGSVYGSARRKPKLMSQALESFITAFSPMALHSADSLGERMFISATPSIAVPASELVTNTNFFGGDIKREPNPYGAQRAASHNYWSTTKEPYVAIAKFMNDTVGGGSSYKSGSVDPLGFMFDADVLDINTDVSPDTLEHLLEYSLGGIYRTGTGVAEAANRYFSGRENTAATVPFINKLVGRDTSDFSDRSNYYDIRQAVNNARTEYRDSDNKREAVETHNGLHLLYRSTLQVDKRLARLREQEDRARDSKRLSARERDDKLLELREKMDDEIDRFYVKYRNHLARRE